MASALAAPSPLARMRPRVLLVHDRRETPALSWLFEGGYDVETAGVGEVLWGWPLDGYDVVLVDAMSHPTIGIELCERIKRQRPNQRVAMIVGNRSGLVPSRFAADAVLSGQPSEACLVGTVNLLLSDSMRTSSTLGESRKPVAVTRDH